jgi:hypothetical protein
MNRKLEPPAGSFEAAELYQLRMALKSTHAQRLQDLQDMLDFNAGAEAENPRLRWVAARLRRQLAESQAPGDDP